VVEPAGAGAAVAAVVGAGVEPVVAAAAAAAAAAAVGVGPQAVVAVLAVLARTGSVRRRLWGPHVEAAAGEGAAPGLVGDHSEVEGCTTTTSLRCRILLLPVPGGLPTDCCLVYFAGPRTRSAVDPKGKPQRRYMPPM
jgi:hypothetical protein